MASLTVAYWVCGEKSEEKISIAAPKALRSISACPAQNLQQAVEMVRSGEAQLALLFENDEPVSAVELQAAGVPLVVVGPASVERVARAMQAGVLEYLPDTPETAANLPGLLEQAYRRYSPGWRETAILDKMQEMVCLLSPNMQALYMNPAIEQACGFNLHEVNRLLAQHNLLPQSWNSLRTALEQIQQDHSLSPSVELEFYRHDGSRFWGEFSLTWYGESGHYAGCILAVGRDITANRRTLAELRASEARFEGLFQSSPMPLFEMDYSQTRVFLQELVAGGIEDLSGFFAANPAAFERLLHTFRVVDVNQTGLAMYHINNREMFRQNFINIIRNQTPTLPQEELQAILTGQTSYEKENVNFDANGDPVFVVARWTVLPGYEQDLSRVVVAITDLTEYRRVVEQLREGEEKFRSFLEQSLDGVTLMDEHGVVQVWNPMMEQISGLPREQAIGRYIWDVKTGLVPPSERPEGLNTRLQASFQNVRDNSGYPGLQTEHFDRPDGQHITIQSVVFPIRLGDRILVGSVSRDVSALVAAEEALNAEKERFRLVAENTSDLITLHSLDGEVLFAGASARRKLSFTLEGLTLTSIKAHIHPEDASIFSDVFRQRSENRGSELITFRVRTGDDEYSWFESTIQPVRDVNGGVTHFVCVSRDVTSRLEAEKMLQETRLKLANRVHELEHRAEEISLLTEMSNLLQTTLQVEEAYQIIAHYAGRLFAGYSGGLYILHPSRSRLALQGSWGKALHSANEFDIDDCWAMRSSRAFKAEQGTLGPVCPHVLLQPKDTYLCAPVTAEGHGLGILYLQADAETGGIDSALTQLVGFAAEQVGLALSNLRLRATLQEQALHDPLTGLYNRYYLEESLEREIHRSQRSGKPVSLLMLDLDNFKSLNTEFGHPNVDIMLREFGKFLHNFIRAGDVACRYGGDEFLVILPDTPLEAARARAEQLREGVKKLSVRDSIRVPRAITVSIGVVSFPRQGGDVMQLLQHVDDALMSAKRQHDCVVVGELEP